MKLQIPGPFTLRISFSLTKDEREDIGNLLSEESREYKQQFSSIDAALDWLRNALKEAP